MGKIYQVVVNGLKGQKTMIDLCNTEEQMQKMTVLQLKEKIAQRLPESTGVESLRLIFTEKPLDENSKLLSDYGIQHMSNIHMVVKVPGGLKKLNTFFSPSTRRLNQRRWMKPKR